MELALPATTEEELTGEEEESAPALQGLAPLPGTPAPAPTTPKARAGADLFETVEKKLRGRVDVPGKGKRRRRQVARERVAEVYRDMMMAGSYKFIRDYLDRSRGKPPMRLDVGRDGVDELRTWLMQPGPAQLGLATELGRLLALAGQLRSKAGQELAQRLELLALTAGAGGDPPPTE